MEKSSEGTASTWDFIFAQDSNESRERAMLVEPFVVTPLWLQANEDISEAPAAVNEEVHVAEAILKVRMASCSLSLLVVK